MVHHAFRLLVALDLHSESDMGIYHVLEKIGIPPTLWQLSSGDYHGLIMRCAPGTHAAALAMIQSQHLPANAKVIELAAGSGAMLARLKDNGFSNLHAVELDHAKFAVPGVTPLSLDLNKDFADQLQGRFDLVVAIEIVEHLDSPRHFLTEIRKSLTETGVALLSTPNVSDWLGRLKFFATGSLRYFNEDQYRWNHHVSPLPDVQLRILCREVGLEIVRSEVHGSFFGPLKKWLLSPLWLPLRAVMGPTAYGDVNLYVLRATQSNVTMAKDWTESP